MNEDMSDAMKKISDMLGNDKLPDNIGDMLKNFTSSNSSNNESSSKESGINNISPEMISNLVSMFGGANNSKNSEQSGSTNIDFETILKLTQVMEKMNSKDNNSANLLYSLKPYLRNERQKKVDQYAKLLNMSKMLELFNLPGGDKHK